jgi:synaptobrevin family protein YKT6
MVADVDYVGHVYARTEGIAGVLLSDKEYPVRVAYSVLSKVLEEFLQRYSPSQFTDAVKPLDFPELHGVLTLQTLR